MFKKLISGIGKAVGGVARFFGGPSENAKLIIEQTAEYIDMAKFTDEEKAESRKENFGLFIEYAKATMPQNLARRLIALKVVDTWRWLIIAAVAGFAFGAEDFSEFVFRVLKEIVAIPFIAIITYYYAKNFIENRNGKKKEKK